MIHRLHSFIAASIVSAAAFLLTAGMVHAQVAWGECPETRVCNQTHCRIELSLDTGPAGAFPPINLAPGECQDYSTPGVVVINAVASAGGLLYPVLPPPLPPCNCRADAWHVCCVSLGPCICCYDVCFDPETCTITILPAACTPGTCRE